MTAPRAVRATFPRTWLLWTAGLLAFPLAGVAGTAVAGRVDSPFAALFGGTVAGLVIGAGQALVSRRRLDPRWWMVNPTVRELVEMQYQFEEPFIVESSKIATKLGAHATPTDQAVADTLDTYRARSSPASSAPTRHRS